MYNDNNSNYNNERKTWGHPNQILIEAPPHCFKYTQGADNIKKKNPSFILVLSLAQMERGIEELSRRAQHGAKSFSHSQRNVRQAISEW